MVWLGHSCSVGNDSKSEGHVVCVLGKVLFTCPLVKYIIKHVNYIYYVRVRIC